MSKGKGRRPTGGAARPPKAAKSGPTSAQQRLAGERAAAARERIMQAQRRRRMFAVGGAVLAVVAIVAVFVIVKVVTDAGGPKSGKKATAAGSSVVKAVSTVPASALNAVGAGDIVTPPTKISAPALTSGGKPRVVYVGAEYCPYCAAERWAFAVAMSRFGTLHNVGQTTSAPAPEVFPSTNTLSFSGATLDSSSLAMTAKEIQSNQVQGNSYAPLDKLSKADEALVQKYNAPPYLSKESSGGIPFIDIGGKYLITGASYDPGVLKGMSHQQIAAALSQPSSKVAKSVDGTANVITAAVCTTTGQQPAAVCNSAGVKAGAAKLGSSG